MVEKKPKPQTRTPGTRRFALPERQERAPEENPMRETIRAAQVTPSQPNLTQPNPSHPIAATRDYNKRHNSIERALSEGLFPGTSQKLYNPLFQRTRGAIKATRFIKATKRKLMEWSGIKSKNTIAVNLKLLTAIGWLKSTVDPGDHDGNVYEVFVYEELTYPIPTQPKSSQPSPTQELGGDPTQKSGWDGIGKVVDSQRTSELPKTSIKTERTNDDEAMPTLRARAGRMPKTEAVLLSLLDTLETRTDVSSPDALLAHVLARKLAPRPATAQQRPNEEQFRAGESRIEVTAEDLEEYERARAELSKT